MNPAWSYVLTAVGITGIYLAGRRNLYGWAVGLGAQVIWIAYAIATEQWGFIVSALAYGSVYANNWRKWARDAHEEERAVMDADMHSYDSGERHG